MPMVHVSTYSIRNAGVAVEYIAESISHQPFLASQLSVTSPCDRVRRALTSFSAAVARATKASSAATDLFLMDVERIAILHIELRTNTR